MPPPPEAVSDLLSTLEKWLHAEDPLPPLVRVGLAHVQCETIHPFLDGNGRIGIYPGLKALPLIQLIQTACISPRACTVSHGLNLVPFYVQWIRGKRGKKPICPSNLGETKPDDLMVSAWRWIPVASGPVFAVG